MIPIGKNTACQWAPGVAPGTSLLPFASGQFQRGSLRSYQTSASTLANAAVNMPAYEDRGDGFGALLSIEGPMTQHTDATENLNGWVGIGSPLPTVNSDVAVAPDGASTADRMNGTGTNGQILYRGGVGLTSSQIITYSLWVKRDPSAPTHAWTGVRVFNEQRDLLTYNFVDVTTTAAWTRFSVTGTTGVGGVPNRTGLSNAPDLHTGSVLAWGSQCELQRYPTRYVPAAVIGQCSEDSLYFAPAQVPYIFRAGRWTQNVYPLWANTDLVSGDQRWLYSFNDGNNGYRFRHNGTNVKLEAVVAGSVVAASNALTLARNAQLQLAIDSAAGIIIVNGSAGPAGSPITMPAGVNLRVGGVIAANNELDGRLSEPLAA